MATGILSPWPDIIGKRTWRIHPEVLEFAALDVIFETGTYWSTFYLSVWKRYKSTLFVCSDVILNKILAISRPLVEGVLINVSKDVSFHNLVLNWKELEDLIRESWSKSVKKLKFAASTLSQWFVFQTSLLTQRFCCPNIDWDIDYQKSIYILFFHKLL
jgi:hypothetical protein